MRKKKADLKNIATYDFETDLFEFGRVPKPFLGVIFHDDKFYVYWGDDCVQKVFDHLVGLDNYLIYAHNGGKFDHHFILPLIVEHNKKNKIFTEPSLIGSRIARLKIGSSELRDSMNLFPVALKLIAKDEIDINLMHPDERDKNKDEIIKYCKGDCSHLYDALIKDRDLYGENLTRAGSAFKYFKKEHMSVKPKNFNISVDTLIRPFYFGGRTQAIETGTLLGDFYVADINSAYPWAMKKEHPYGEKPVKIKTCLDKGIAEKSFFRLKARSWGAFPLRDEKGGLSFPCDGVEREYCVTGWEVLAGIRTDTIKIIEVIEQLCFPETINFKSYVDEFFKMKDDAKKAGDKFMVLNAKLMLNSLYGKFSQDPLAFEDVVLGDSFDMPEMNEKGYKAGEIIGGFRAYKKKSHYIEEETGKWNKIPHFNNCGVGASITGCVRAFLWESILKTDHPVYCDTDSIICEGYGDLKISDECGDWELEGKNIKKVCIAGKKLYSTFQGDDLKPYKKGCKGAKLDHGEIERVVNGEEMTYKFEGPSFSVIRGPRFVERRINRIETDSDLQVYLRGRKKGVDFWANKREEKRVEFS